MNRINIDQPENCCGCGACAAVCPRDCIAMHPDAEGFPTPRVDTARCIDCGHCLQTCPWIARHEFTDRIAPPEVYAAWHRDAAVREASSSGGVFTALAEATLTEGGVVVGAAFDDDLVCRHVLIDHLDDLHRLRGSKYVQSELSSKTFRAVRNLLAADRTVLFSGTPCQVGGVRNVLGDGHGNLVCCDLVCHGVPSPAWFNQHIGRLARNGVPLASFRFRDKARGWRRGAVCKTWLDGRTRTEARNDDLYMSAFLENLSLRESCYTCPFATVRRQGDVTLADYWNVASQYPAYDMDDQGTSLVLVNSNKGRAMLDMCRDRLFLGEADLAHAMSINAHLSRPCPRRRERTAFYRDAFVMTESTLRRRYGLRRSPPWWRRALRPIGRIAKRIARCT